MRPEQGHGLSVRQPPREHGQDKKPSGRGEDAQAARIVEPAAVQAARIVELVAAQEVAETEERQTEHNEARTELQNKTGNTQHHLNFKE